MATQTQTKCETMNGHLVQYPFKTENTANAIRIPSRSAEPSRRSNKSSRERLFAALEHGNPILRAARTIESADDLEEAELKRCFEILHACGSATDEEASLKKTRETIEEFLDAIFKDWSTENHQEMNKPVMDFIVREAVAVGKICDYPGRHSSIDECTDSRTCNSTVFVVAVYNSQPATLQMGFCLQTMLDQPASQNPDFFSPMERHDIRWMNLNFMPLLKRWITDACVTKVHRHNKHLAIWLTRKLIRGWAIGSLDMGDNDLISNYIGTESVNATFATMGLIGTG